MNPGEFGMPVDLDRNRDWSRHRVPLRREIFAASRP
jgi:hypothetical protein